MGLVTKKADVITVRIDPKIKTQLIKLAQESRREFSDYMRLILEDVAKNKTKV